MKATVVGSGAWGTALAIRLCKNGHDVTMWTYDKALIPEMEATRRNPRLPNVVMPEALKISGDYACAVGAKLVVMASPSFPLRSVSKGVAPYIDEDAVVHWGEGWFPICVGFAMSTLIVWMHRSNIVRLVKGEERKTNLLGKGKKQ